MLLENTMLLWMPVDEELYGANQRQGTVVLAERGTEDNPEFPMSAGACDIDWNSAPGHAERLELLQHHISFIIWESGVSKQSVLNALKGIEDINPRQLDLDRKPEPDKE